MSLNERSIVFVCFGCVISQNLFRNLTFEIIDYLKCRSNRSSWPHLNQILEFSLNRPTTSPKPMLCNLLTYFIFVVSLVA